MGKTTFLNTLFQTDLMPLKHAPFPAGSTMNLEGREFLLEEEGVQVELTLLDTPGFGDALNRESKYLP